MTNRDWTWESPIPGSFDELNRVLSPKMKALEHKLGGVQGDLGFINVMDYGATGNGATDDTTAVKDAIAAGASDGLPIIAPSGDYKITSQLLFDTPNTKMHGVFGHDKSGSGRVASTRFLFDLPANTPAIKVTAKHVELAHFAVGEFSGGTTDIGVLVDDEVGGAGATILRVTLRDITVDGVNSHGFKIVEPELVLIEDCMAMGCGGSGLWMKADTAGTGISVTVRRFRAASCTSTNHILIEDMVSVLLEGVQSLLLPVDGVGIKLDNCLDCVLLQPDCEFQSDGGIGILVEGGSGNTIMGGLGNDLATFIKLDGSVGNKATRTTIITSRATSSCAVGIEVTANTLHTVVLNPRNLATTPYTIAAGQQGFALQDGMNRWEPVFFTDGDVTPSVSMGRVFRTQNSTSKTITDFDDEGEGQVIEIFAGDSNTIIANNSTIQTNTGSNKALTQGLTYHFTFVNTKWRERAHDALEVLVTKTGTYLATTSDQTILCDATSAAFTVTLPAASGLSGKVYHIKKIDSSGNDVTVDGNASETIDGSTTAVISTPQASITIQCDGSNWHII